MPKAELDKFNNSFWWQKGGHFDILRNFNKIRIPYIVKHISSQIKRPFSDLAVLDVGCGGGIVTEGLFDAGLINITGIDLAEKAIFFAENNKGSRSIEYKNITISDITETFDVVTCLEIIEHVDNYQEFIVNTCQHVKKDGIMLVSTINKTIRAAFESILAPEYLLGMVEKGTHHFSKLIRPFDITSNIKRKFTVLDISGISYDIINKNLYFRANIESNYIMAIRFLD